MKLSEKEYERLKYDTIFYMVEQGFTDDEICDDSINDNIKAAFDSLTKDEKTEYILLSEDVLSYIKGREISEHIVLYLYLEGMKNRAAILINRTILIVKRFVKEHAAKTRIRRMMRKYPISTSDIM